MSKATKCQCGLDPGATTHLPGCEFYGMRGQEHDPLWLARDEFRPRLDALYAERDRRHAETAKWFKEERRQLDVDFAVRLAEIRAR